MAHTPGPWRLSGPNDGRNADVVAGIEGGDPSYVLCDVYQDVEELKPSAIANARLIAAAPDLLAALKRLLAPEPGGVYATNDVIQVARLAIAKAEGK